VDYGVEREKDGQNNGEKGPMDGGKESEEAEDETVDRGGEREKDGENNREKGGKENGDGPIDDGKESKEAKDETGDHSREREKDGGKNRDDPEDEGYKDEENGAGDGENCYNYRYNERYNHRYEHNHICGAGGGEGELEVDCGKVGVRPCYESGDFVCVSCCDVGAAEAVP
jgi:hypothetical protein